MAYYNARRVVERLIPIFSMERVIRVGVTDLTSEDTSKTLELFSKATEAELPKESDSKKLTVLHRRANEAYTRAIVAPAVEQEFLAAKVGLSVYYFLKNLIMQDLYDIPEGSSLEEAMDITLNALQEWVKEDRLDKSAFKEAQRILKRLQTDGYYQGVNWVIEFE
jgi:hypothetical protein